MAWKILCSLSDYNPETLKAKLKSNIAGATKNYKHAFLITSSAKTMTTTEKGVTAFEYSEQKFNSQSLRDGLKAGPVEGYVEWGTGPAVVVDEGTEDIGDLVPGYGKAFAKKAGAPDGKAKKYPIDCLGFCVTIVKQTTGRGTVAGHATGL